MLEQTAESAVEHRSGGGAAENSAQRAAQQVAKIAAAGTVLNGGLGGLLKQLQQSGQGDVARSWVGTGPNKTISQGDLAGALGTDTLDKLSEQTGMDRADLLSGLSQHLPRFVDQLTPDGRLPTEEEAARMV